MLPPALVESKLNSTGSSSSTSVTSGSTSEDKDGDRGVGVAGEEETREVMKIDNEEPTTMKHNKTIRSCSPGGG